MRSRIMYIESKAEGLNGRARIGRITFSKTGRTLYYKGQLFQSLKGYGFNANYRETETGEEYWIRIRVAMDWTVSTERVR
jgi:hypothetical protein